jgi:hypothetical protein
MPLHPVAPHGPGHSTAPRAYRRKKDNTAAVISILSVIGVLVVGGVFLAIAFSPRNEPDRGGTASLNPPTSPVPVAENLPAATKGTSKSPLPAAAPSERVVRREPSVGLDSASRELGAAMRSWKAGESYETIIASDSPIAEIDLPEWKDRGYSLEKSSMNALPSTSAEERQIWLTLRFMNQDAEPVMRLYSVKLNENGKLIFEKLEDKAPPTQRERPADSSPRPPSEPARPAAPLTPPEEGTADES